MLTIVYGVPGSGKTYYAVLQISQILKKNPDAIIVSNIENLQLQHVSFEHLLNEYGSLESLFNTENSFWANEKKKILVIDEAQRYFHRKYFSNSVFFFFQYHRHLNIDIYLISQSYKNLASELVYLAELVIEAVPSSLRFFQNSFKYVIRDLETREIIERFSLPFRQEVADLYRSAIVIQTQRKLTYPQKMLFFSLLFVLLALSGVFYFLYSISMFPKTETEQQPQQVQQQVQQPQQVQQQVQQPQQVQQSTEKESNIPVPPSVFENTDKPWRGYREYIVPPAYFDQVYRSDVIHNINHIRVFHDDGTQEVLVIFEKRRFQDSGAPQREKRSVNQIRLQ